MRAKGILAALVGTRKAQLFRSTAWPAEPLVHHGPVSRLPALLREGALSSFANLAATVEVDSSNRGVSAPASGFRGDVLFHGSRGAQNGYSVRAASASRLLQAGLNVSFHEFSLPSIELWLRSFAREVGIPFRRMRLYAFAAPRGKREGTDPHWDPNEVIHVQLEGTKTIKLASNPHVSNPDLAMRAGMSFPEDLLAQFRDDVPIGPPRKWRTFSLRPGSVAYFPRGTWHETLTKGPSFAVTFAFYWPTAGDVAAAYLHLRLRQYESWRQPQFGILINSSRRAHQKKLESLMSRFGISPVMFPPQEALNHSIPAEQRVLNGDGHTTYVRMPFSMTLRRRNDRSFMIRIDTNRGHGSLEFDADPGLTAVMKLIARRRTPFNLDELAAFNSDVPRRTLVRLLALLTENEAIQLDCRTVGRLADAAFSAALPRQP